MDNLGGLCSEVEEGIDRSYLGVITLESSQGNDNHSPLPRLWLRLLTP
jgi:hypothetical protein